MQCLSRVLTDSCVLTQGHLKVAAVLDAARLKASRGLAAMPSGDTGASAGDGSGLCLGSGMVPAEAAVNQGLSSTRDAAALALEWGTGVLAGAGAGGASAHGEGRYPSRGAVGKQGYAPGFARSDSWACEAWSGLMDAVVALVLRVQ